MRSGHPSGRAGHGVKLALLVLQVFVWTLLLGRGVLAQSPDTPQDSVPKDSEPHKRAGLGCEMCLGVGLAALTAVELIAPSVFLLSPKFTNPGPGALPDHHFTVFLTGGDGARFRQGTDRWAYSENVEVLMHGIYGEVRIENFYTPDHVQFQTIRTGYLAHPKPALLGGVTLGYRAAHGDQSQNALEVGLPTRVGTERGAFRLEPTYLISGAGVSWNYRLLFEFYIARTRLVTGANFEAKPLRQGGPYFGTMALVLGTRF